MMSTPALARNLNRNSAARFSFLLSIPAILGAMTLTLKDIVTGGDPGLAEIGALPIIVGFIFAAVSGFLAIKFMISVVNRGKLKYFSLYVFILGILLTIDQFATHIIYA